MKKIKSIALSLRDELLLAEMNMWYGVKQLAERWNGFPCFGQSLFAKTPWFLSATTDYLSYLLEANIQAYRTASRQEIETSKRIDWIGLYHKWYASTAAGEQRKMQTTGIFLALKRTLNC